MSTTTAPCPAASRWYSRKELSPPPPPPHPGITTHPRMLGPTLEIHGWMKRAFGKKNERISFCVPTPLAAPFIASNSEQQIPKKLLQLCMDACAETEANWTWI